MWSIWEEPTTDVESDNPFIAAADEFGLECRLASGHFYKESLLTILQAADKMIDCAPGTSDATERLKRMRDLLAESIAGFRAVSRDAEWAESDLGVTRLDAAIHEGEVADGGRIVAGRDQEQDSPSERVQRASDAEIIEAREETLKATDLQKELASEQFRDAAENFILAAEDCWRSAS